VRAPHRPKPIPFLPTPHLPPACLQVRALDAWGNPTAPTAHLQFKVAVASSGLEPDAAMFDVDER
jgi:hypothetical protein